MSAGHPANVVVYPYYKLFVFCAQLLLLPFSINSGLLFISNHHSLLPSLSWQEDAFLLPCLFSSVCAHLFFTQLCSTAASGQENIYPGHARSTCDDFPQGSLSSGQVQ